ncbi:methyltransferase domain-containing protein [Colletotrichum tofieldiae]|nr:methyltransferase domain-containing protein [Colletotrichum tofieldiae]
MADNQIAATADESTALVSVFGSVADPASPSNIGPDRAPNHGPVLEAEAENDAVRKFKEFNINDGTDSLP